MITYDGGTNRLAETDYSYDQTALGSVSAIGHDDLNYPANFQGPRGNTTSKTARCFPLPPSTQTCTDAAAVYSYDSTGQVVSVKDPNLKTTQYSYTDNYLSGFGSPPGNTNAYVSTITHPTVNGVTTHDYFQYAYSDGQLTASQDDNEKAASKSTTYSYADSLRRLTETDYPDGGKKTLCYKDTAGQCADNILPVPSILGTTLIDGTTTLTTTSTMDGLGHVVKTQLTSDPAGTDITDTTYDGMGRVWTQSNPHRSTSSTTDGITTYIYDALGRTCVVAPPDGTPVTGACPTSRPASDAFTSYSGKCNTVIDQAGNSRTSCSDGLGRLTQVFEDPAGLNYETDYQYNALNDLTRVDQIGSDSTKTRTRTFQYDSLSRLTSATNPESGTIGYAYDANGNLVTKTAPIPNKIPADTSGSLTVTTAYSYDALNRLTQKNYNDGSTPTVKYGYDGTALSGCANAPPDLSDSYKIGRRTAMCDAAGSTSWNHDVMGRTATEKRLLNATAAVTNMIVYTYNLDGSLKTLVYPSGRTITYTAGGAGRALEAKDIANSINYVKSATYAPSGRPDRDDERPHGEL